jgi:hypothetical protein
MTVSFMLLVLPNTLIDVVVRIEMIVGWIFNEEIIKCVPRCW